MNEELIQRLDQYDFSPFITDGIDFYILIDRIECQYDNDFFQKYRCYMFDELQDEEIMLYLKQRYNIYFQEYTSWVVRKGGK